MWVACSAIGGLSTAIGHDAAVFRDPIVKQHLTGGIM
jgi:hypothetical protein